MDTDKAKSSSPVHPIGWERVEVDPVFRSGTPEWYCRVADDQERAGNTKLASAFRGQASQIEYRAMQRVLGENWSVAASVAHFLAACLRSKRRLPAGAPRWMAQHALTAWLRHLPSGERREVVDMLRNCTAGQLGRELKAAVDAEIVRRK